ncbi:MBL fold metallo-hydrolase [Sulfodiicoccus acidiphilus]|uniref:MBL fold metallo-hydrolase n=2 Tax=Sulfodiicoccus acidiphilus TaxID=1670455 RepID=A0A348B447_9CREN|nr:MBL fold metallo-hydrolase [Sulfodiicoccus acidiphilus]GGT87790.1 MBL fold metallo-hydrolase [Sulfodiicoccus acidiphilus]
MMIDPGPSNSVADLGFLDRLDYVFLTHLHIDHIGLLKEVVERFPNVVVLVPEGEGGKITSPEKVNKEAENMMGELVTVFGKVEPIKTTIREVGDGEEIDLGDRKGKVSYTPGHSNAHISFILDDILFAGDSLGGRINGRSFKIAWSDRRKFMEVVERTKSMRPKLIGISHSGLVGYNHLNEVDESMSGAEVEELSVDGGTRDQILRLYLSSGNRARAVP